MVEGEVFMLQLGLPGESLLRPAAACQHTLRNTTAVVQLGVGHLNINVYHELTSITACVEKGTTCSVLGPCDACDRSQVSVGLGVRC